MIAATRLALTSSLVYFMLGTSLGLLLGVGAISPAWRSAHAHVNLLGFVAMMIYGVAYHALPRFRGVRFRRPRAAVAQVAVANVGLLGMGLTWGLRLPSTWFAVWGGLSWLAAVAFAVLLLEVLWGRP